MMIERQKEAEKSQLELKQWMEKRRSEIENEQEQQKKTMLKLIEKQNRESKRKII